MGKLFSVHSETVTPESAEYGDVESRDTLAHDVTLREAWPLVHRMAEGGIEPDCWPISLRNPPRWFTF